jgi:hypothetical protein
MELRTDAELKQLPALKFTGDNVREFLDKFPASGFKVHWG